MKYLIGLGNPGATFTRTRHNVGFMTLDAFALHYHFPDFVLEKKYHALITEQEQLLLAKPQTFMNESGTTLRSLVKYKNLTPESLIVIHDDIDLPLGSMKIVKDSGSGGHRGVESLIEHLGTQNFIRLKIGICPAQGKPKGVEHFVIKKFTAGEIEVLTPLLAQATEALHMLATDELAQAMNHYNG